MTIKSYPFTSNVTYDASSNPIYDRAVDAEFLRAFYQKDRGNGVLMLGDSSSFLVQASTPASRNVVIKPGYCFIQGAYAINDADTTITIDTADSTVPRIDSIVLRLDIRNDYRNINLYYKKGTAKSSPTAPALTRTNEQYEIGIANVHVPAASSVVQNQHIEDTRMDKDRCGSSLPLQEIDTTNLYKQLQDQITQNMALIQSALDATTAGYLQNQITAIVAKLYPVGSYFISSTQNTSPASVIGGTWEQLDGMFIRAIGTSESDPTITDMTDESGGVDSYTKTFGYEIGNYYNLVALWRANYSSHPFRFFTKAIGDSGDVRTNLTVTRTSAIHSTNAAAQTAARDYTNLEVYRESYERSFENKPRYKNAYVWRRIA